MYIDIHLHQNIHVVKKMFVKTFLDLDVVSLVKEKVAEFATFIVV